MWWGVATLTTVGYGGVFPITPAGKVLSNVIAVLGLGLFAIPTGILASGFSEHLQDLHNAYYVHLLPTVRGKSPVIRALFLVYSCYANGHGS
jgi:voltage-gated potassium channel